MIKDREMSGARFSGSFGIFAAGTAAERVQRDTGFSDYILGQLWDKYGDFMPDVQQGHPAKKEAYFYLCFKFIKHAPRPSHVQSTLWTPHTGHISAKTFERQIQPRLLILGQVMDEVHWTDRLDPMNHCVHWPNSLVGCLDTYPCTVSTPSVTEASRIFYQPKYHACVFKVQIIIDLNGRIVYYSVPHLGVTSDTKIWSKTRPRFNEGEFVLADGAYLSSWHCMVPYKAADGQELTADEDKVNSLIQLYRARVEHVIGLVQNCELFRSKCRMGIELSVSCVKIFLHATALHLRETSLSTWRYPSTMLSTPRPH